jgi:hypothetical protein
VHAGRILLVVIWAAVLAAATFAVTDRTSAAARASYQLIAPPPLADLDPRFLDLLTLGHRDLYDDFLTVWTIEMLADEQLKQHDPDKVNAALLQTLRHRPKVESLYMLACFVMGLDLNKPEHCEALTLAGLEALPRSWRIPVTQGFMYAYRMNDTKSAAMYYGLAASRPGAPAYLHTLALKLVSGEATGLTIPQMQQTLDAILDVPGGTKFGDFLRDGQRRQSGGTP